MSPPVSGSELSDGLDPVLEKLARGVETFPQQSTVPLDNLASLAWVIGDAIVEGQPSNAVVVQCHQG